MLLTRITMKIMTKHHVVDHHHGPNQVMVVSNADRHQEQSLEKEGVLLAIQVVALKGEHRQEQSLEKVVVALKGGHHREQSLERVPWQIV
jgi:hypothetical protein